MTTVIKLGDKFVAITKGAPDRVIGLTHNTDTVKLKALRVFSGASSDSPL